MLFRCKENRIMKEWQKELLKEIVLAVVDFVKRKLSD